MPPLAGIPKSKAYNHPIASQTDELKYRTKYRQLKAKCSGLEEENVKLQIEIFQTKRSIQRMRLERSILFDYIAEKRAPLHAHNPALSPQHQQSKPNEQAQPLQPQQDSHEVKTSTSPNTTTATHNGHLHPQLPHLQNSTSPTTTTATIQEPHIKTETQTETQQPLPSLPEVDQQLQQQQHPHAPDSATVAAPADVPM